MQRWGGRLAGVVLTGSTGRPPFIVTGIAPLLGPDKPSSLAYKLVFDGLAVSRPGGGRRPSTAFSVLIVFAYRLHGQPAP